MTRFLLPILLVIIAIVAFFSLGRPLLDEIGGLKSQVADLRAGEDSLLRLLERQNRLLELYNQFSEEQKADLNKFLPDNIDHVRLIIDINSIAERYGLDLRNLTIKSAVADSGEAAGEDLINQDSVVIGFSVTASYSLLKTLLTDLAESLRLLDLSSFALTTAESGLYQYNIEIRTYWLP